MLKIKNIKKTYKTGDFIQHALDGISINFRKNEFVSVLGPSGSGKTTLLNIVGGLDQYDEGDLIINNISTKDFSQKDWDNYRNKRIGFVFQSYNLISHQNVLSNVELAMTLAGVSKKIRREKALNALEKVGLKDHINKKPNQLSGGQMQRVAIARALVNDPEILLADEPTGALDSKTSSTVMDLLKEIAEEKLVIMVTHNPELANEYSNRIVELKDGKIISDSNPYEGEDEKATSSATKEKVSMSFLTALGLSFNNLKTKKGRTILTAFAGSIGIIGIALILSLSNGMQDYIKTTEEDTLSSYPITIQNQGIDLMAMSEERMETAESMNEKSENQNPNTIYQGGFVGDTLKMRNIRIKENDLSAFKEFIEAKDGANIKESTSAITYDYGTIINAYLEKNNEYIKVNPSQILSSENANQSFPGGQDMGPQVFTQIIDNKDLIMGQYDILSGHYPENYNQAVVVVDENNQISDLALYTLGFKDQDELKEIDEKIANGEEVFAAEYPKANYSFNEFIGLKYKILPQSYYYDKVDGLWLNKESDNNFINSKLDDAIELKIVGILKPKEGAVSSTINGTIGYTKDLTDKLIEFNNDSQVVKDQKNNDNIDVFTGKEFIYVENISDEDFIASLPQEDQLQLNNLPEAEKAQMLERYKELYDTSYDKNMESLNSVDYSKPVSINLYLKDFESRDKIVEAIDNYNNNKKANGQDEAVIEYTDLVGLMTSSITSIIDMITYLLIGFVSISLVVSSIMIGIITYISVLERTKEIGILRSIGASKKDIARVFNAETSIIGLTAGGLGILTSLLLLIPINKIIYNLSDVENLASLPWQAAITLVIISVILTLIAGLIPSRLAAKKDPVIALRSE